jgi:hypothetical protein
MNVRNFVSRIIWHITPLTAALVCIFLFKLLDQSFDVVKDFKITNQSLTPSGVMIEGTLDKRRNCTFEEVVGYTSEGRQIFVNFLDKPQGAPNASRAVRVQMWGPWEVMSGNAQTISLYARHSCHMFWPHVTLLTKFTVVKVEDIKDPHALN